MRNLEGINIVSLNVEGHRNLGLVVPFLQKTSPDVALMQEVFEPDLQQMAKLLGMNSLFAPMCTRPLEYFAKGEPYRWGVAILTRGDMLHQRLRYYHEDADHIPEFGQGISGAIEPVVAQCIIEHDKQEYSLATTHFPWAPNGLATEEQRIELRRLLAIMKLRGEIILGGDTNAPRGGEIFGELSSQYKDNIPPDVKTTIDGARHKAGPLQLVVDGLFTSPEYEVINVTVTDGVSDHCAITANINKRV